MHTVFPKNLIIFISIFVLALGSSSLANDIKLSDYIDETLHKSKQAHKENPKEAERILLELWDKVASELSGEEALVSLYKIAVQSRKYKDLNTARELAYKTRELASSLENRDIFIDISLIAADLERKTLSNELALESLAKIYQYLDKYPKDVDYANAYNLNANIFKSQKEHALSAKMFLKALEYSKKCGDTKKEIRSLRNLASSYRRLNQYDKALLIAIEGSALARQLGESSTEASFYMISAETERKKGHYKASIHYAFKAMRLYEQLGDHAELAKVHGTLGQSYMRNCRYDLALEHAMMAYEIVSMDENPAIEIAKYCNNIGNIYERLGDMNKASDYYQKAYTLSVGMDQIRYQAESLSNQGSIFTSLYQYEEAYENLKKAHKIHQDIKNERGVANTSYKLGQLLYKMKDYPEALAYLNKGKRITTKVKDSWLLGKLCLLEALILYKNADIQASLDISRKAMGYADTTNSLSLKSQIHQHMATVYESLEDYKNAFIHTKKQADLNDDIMNAEILESVSDIEHLDQLRWKENEIKTLEKEKRIVELENEKRTNELRMLENETLINKIKMERAENARYFIYGIGVLILLFVIFRYFSVVRMRKLLGENNVLIQEKNDQLNASNKAKDKFFSIISHDLKGPLGSVISLSELLESEYDEMSEEDTLQFVKDINLSANKTFKLLEELLDWARLQLKAYRPRLKNCDLNEIISSSVASIKDRADAKGIYIEIDEFSNEEIEADIGMISSVIRNLLTNAIKFSPEGETINLFVKRVNDRTLELHIKDSGVGIPKDEQLNLFKIDHTMSHKGTAGETGTGLGLIICKEMIEQHGCEIGVNSQPGYGSDFFFTLNLFNK